MAANLVFVQRPFFLACFSALLTHEMDAVRELEWRILFPFSLIKDDEAAHTVFSGVHVPLYMALIYGVAGSSKASHSLASALSLFAIGHAVVHGVFRYNGWGGFRSLFSKTLIYGAAVAGALDLLYMM